MRPLIPIAMILSVLAAPAAAADDAGLPVTILDLPFAVKAMRGPGSEVALAVSTSGLLPIARPKPASANPKAPPPPPQDDTDIAPVAVVWGEGGGAVLSLEGGIVKTTLIGAEAVEGLVASETPRGAVPGSRRALSGPLSVYLSGPTRGASGLTGQAAGLTIRERQPLGVTGDPKPVPIATSTLPAGADSVFAARPPRIATIDGKPVVLAVTAGPKASSALVLAAKDASGAWTIAARTPSQAGRQPDGAPLAPAAIADFSASGRPHIAVVREPDGAGVLQLWSYADGVFSLAAEAPGYAGPPTNEVDLAAVVPADLGKAPGLALPTADHSTLAIVSLKGDITERARILLPGPATLGVAALGRGADARVLVGLADGRLVVVPTRAPGGIAP